MATIYDVARAAGVSAKTVSRVLNGDAPVGKTTRDTVQLAIADLGYVPSKAARTMRSSRSGLVGLITGAISLSGEPAESRGLPDLLIVQGFQRGMTDAGRTLMIADTGGRQAEVPRLVRTFLEHRVEGLVYVADYHQEVELPPVPKATPLVLLNCFDRIGSPAVVPDDRGCQEALVARLIAAGHRRIGYLTLGPKMTATPLRVAGYRAAHAAAGLPADPALVRSAKPDGAPETSGHLLAELDALLALTPPPTVICCGNDEMAMRVYGMLRSRGLRVPEDVSVAGFDNHRVIAETLYPPLTTVELAYTAMGRRGAEMLLRQIAGAGRPEAPDIVAGPVFWRDSVTEQTNIARLTSKGRTTR